jgi:hypothetical protein
MLHIRSVNSCPFEVGFRCCLANWKLLTSSTFHHILQVFVKTIMSFLGILTLMLLGVTSITSAAVGDDSYKHLTLPLTGSYLCANDTPPAVVLISDIVGCAKDTAVAQVSIIDIRQVKLLLKHGAICTLIHQPTAVLACSSVHTTRYRLNKLIQFNWLKYNII